MEKKPVAQRGGAEQQGAEDGFDVPLRDFIVVQLIRVVTGILFRTTDVLLLLLRPRLLRVYMGIWWVELFRSPYRWPRSFEAVRAVRASGQSLRELVYGETPLVTALWLFWRAGLGKGGRLVDVGAGRGRALLAARWLGAEARGIELLEDHVSKVAGLLRRVGIELVTGDATRAELSDASHLYAAWTGFSPETKRRVIERFRTCRPGTCIITVTRPVEAPGFTVRSRSLLLYPWGFERAWIQELRG